jgi:GTP-binding protein HflX
LVESFKATLEEAVQADILLHVIDVSHPKMMECSGSVYKVLKDLHIEEKVLIDVLNKKDKIDDEVLLANIKGRFVSPVVISALKKEGLDGLIDRLVIELSRLMTDIKITLTHKDMKKYNIIHEYGNVLKKVYRKDSIYIEARIPIKLKQAIFLDK